MRVFLHLISICFILIIVTFKSFGQIETNVNTSTFCNSSTLTSVVVPIEVKNMNGIKSISLTLNYDNTAYSYTGYDNVHSSLNGGFLLVNNTGTSINIAWFNLVGSASISNGILLRLKFTGTGQASNLTWDTESLGACEYSDLNNQVVTATYVDALPSITLGNDITTIDGSAILDAGHGFSTYSWSTGEVTQTIQATTSGQYAVTVTDANGCANSDVIDVQLNVALPVELSSFELYKQAESILLEWRTSSEINNKGFEVQKSEDGYNWETLGFIDGNGSSNSQNEYYFVDNSPNYGENYYRLKQIDFDGNSEYSNVVNIYWEREALSTKLYPNPSSGNLFLDLNNPSQEEYTIQIFDLSGKLIGTEKISDFFVTNTYQVQTRLRKGTYIVRVNGLSKPLIQKIIIN